MNKRGLNGVVTTVLIILIAVAAVAAIWITTKPVIEKTERTVSSQGACVDNIIELKSCQRINVPDGRNGYNVAYIMSKADNKKINKILTVLKNNTYSLSTNVSLIPSIGELSSTQILTESVYNEVSLVIEYTSGDGNAKTTCESEKISCRSIESIRSSLGSSGSGSSSSAADNNNNGGNNGGNPLSFAAPTNFVQHYQGTALNLTWTDNSNLEQSFYVQWIRSDDPNPPVNEKWDEDQQSVYGEDFTTNTSYFKANLFNKNIQNYWWWHIHVAAYNETLGYSEFSNIETQYYGP